MRVIQGIPRAVVYATLVMFAGCHASSQEQEAAITASMMKTFDRPETRLVAGPVAVHGDAAVADWTQGDLGGRALLRRRDTGWHIVLCAGDGIRSEAGLLDAGLSADQAKQIAAELAADETVVSAGRLATMSAFKGVVRMDSSGTHTPTQNPHSAAH